MASQTNGDSSGSSAETDFAKAFKELAQGEQTATALENNLSALESKIEELLARAAEDEKTLKSPGTNESTAKDDKAGG